MNDDLIALGLRARGTRQTAALPRDLLDQLLELLRDVVATSDLIDAAALAERIERCRTLATRAPGTATVEASVLECLAVCRQALSAFEKQRVGHREEIATLVGMIREALAIVAGDSQSFGKSLVSSMDRFEALVRIDDLPKLKMALVKEVGSLRSLAAERQKNWEQTSARFHARIELLERQLSESQREAALDPLTQVANRGAFDRACNEWITSGKRQFALALLDIDHFKSINDTLGHPIGDRAITLVAKTLKESVRSSQDVVARFGGDEFAVLMAEATLQQAAHRLRMVATGLAAVSLGPEEAPMKITLSCGIVELSAGDTPASLVERADAALYEAKRLGRNRVVTKEKPTLRDLMRH
jgi:diguanylate cyclase